MADYSNTNVNITVYLYNSITHHLRASTHAVEPEMNDAIIVSAHVKLCPIKYSNFEYEGKTPK